MSRFVLALAAGVLATLTAAAGQPERKAAPGYPYPAKAPVVVCLNGYDKARDRLAKLATAALPAEAPRLLKQFDEHIEAVLDGRKLTALRKDARIYLVVNDLTNLIDEEGPAASVVVPITSYREFGESFLTKDELKSIDKGRDGVDAFKTAAFGEEMPAYMVDLGDHVALTLDRATAETYAGKYARGSAEQMGAELAESFLKADLSVYVNMDAINEQFGEQIRGVKGLIDFGLQQAAQQGSLPGFSKKQMDSLKVFLKGAFQGVEDCRAILATAEFRPDGLAFKLQARFAEDTASAKFLASERPAPHAEIVKLPAGLGVYGGMRFGRTISELMRDIGQELSTTEQDVQGARLLAGHQQDLRAAGHEGDVSAATVPGLSLTVSNYKDPEKAARALTKSYKAIAAGGKVGTVLVKAAPRVSDEAGAVGDFKFAEVLLRFDFEATVADLPDQVRETTLKSLKRSMTEDTRMYIGTDGKVLVQIAAKDWDAARDLFARYLDGKSAVGQEAGFKLTRSQLPAEANFFVIAETGSALNTMLDSVRSAADVVPGFPHVPALKAPKGEPTYVGLALTLKGETATLTAFAPTAAIGVAGKMVEPLFKKIE
jgi:hypothetical protein